MIFFKIKINKTQANEHNCSLAFFLIVVMNVNLFNHRDTE